MSARIGRLVNLPPATATTTTTTTTSKTVPVRPAGNGENIPPTNRLTARAISRSEQAKKPPVPISSSSISKKRLTPQELRDKLAEARTKIKAQVQELANAKSEITSLKSKINELELHSNTVIENNAALTKDSLELKTQITSLERDLKASRSKIIELDEIIDNNKKERDDLNAKVTSGLQLIGSLQQDIVLKATQLSTMQSLSESRSQTISSLQSENQQLNQRIKELEESAHADEIKRKQLHNQVQELKGNIRVFCRVRPCIDGNAPTAISFPDMDMIEILGRNDVSVDGSSSSRRMHSFQFDRVFNPSCTQEDVWQEISQLCTSAIDGYKVAVFAYGQTGSGKTFTMEGPSDCHNNSSLQGMIPRAINQIFERFTRMAERSWSFVCTASYVEIYNEQIFDLLVTGLPGEEDLKIKHGSDGSTEVIGAVVQRVSCNEDLIPLLHRASNNRSTATTKQNERSSRSHSVFQLTIRGHNEFSGQDTVGVLNLIDLAGSERLKRSESTGDTLKETQSINKSLSCLGDVISALSNKSKHVPYRNSKLTYLLQNCFGGDSKCLMFVNISPEEENVSESLCSLRFASKVNSCHIGTAKRTIKQQ